MDSAPAWLAELDVQFARLYLSALQGVLLRQQIPGCWRVLFGCRDQTSIARIQFALAGINAHINHDLSEAIVGTPARRGPPREVNALGVLAPAALVIRGVDR